MEEWGDAETRAGALKTKLCIKCYNMEIILVHYYLLLLLDGSCCWRARSNAAFALTQRARCVRTLLRFTFEWQCEIRTKATDFEKGIMNGNWTVSIMFISLSFPFTCARLMLAGAGGVRQSRFAYSTLSVGVLFFVVSHQRQLNTQ